MSRSRRNEPSFFDELFQFLQVVPFWVGPILAAVVFAGMRWVIPAILTFLLADNEVASFSLLLFSRLSEGAAPLLAGAVIVVWVVAEVKKLIDGPRFHSKAWSENVQHPDPLDSDWQDLNWHEFECLLAEAFRRQGFMVHESGGARPDGGIDLRLDKAGATTLVQCKHWKSRQVGVTVVRELLGVVASEVAQSGIVVASGRFTDAAIEFAEANPIRLIDGRGLAKMIREAQTTSSPQAQRLAAAPLAPTQKPAVPACPECGSPMRQRTASKGSNAGRDFWGCSTFPRCRGTRQLQGSL